MHVRYTSLGMLSMRKSTKTVQKTTIDPGGFEFIDGELHPDFPLSIGTNSRCGGDYKNGLYHYHNFLEFGICLKGTGTFIIEDRSIRFAPGDIIVIGPGLIHIARSDAGNESRWTWIYADVSRILSSRVDDVDVLDCSAYSVTSCPVMHMSKTAHPYLCTILDNLTREYLESGSHDVMRALLVLANTYLRRQIQQQATAGPCAAMHPSDIARIIPALKLINDRFDSRLSVVDMASACFMGERSFCRAFEQAMHETPHAYLVRFRISQACGVLRASNMSINQIAGQCGFESLSSFNRNFRSVMHTMPIVYRKAGGMRNR